MQVRGSSTFEFDGETFEPGGAGIQIVAIRAGATLHDSQAPVGGSHAPGSKEDAKRWS